MRIGYYVPATLHRHAGIRARVAMTMRAWERLGVPSTLVTGPAADPDSRRAEVGLAHLAADRAAAVKMRALVEEGEVTHVHHRLFLPTAEWLRVPGPMSVEVHARLRRPESRRDVFRVVGGWRRSQQLTAHSVAGAFITGELADQPEYRQVSARCVVGNGIELTDPAPAPANALTVFGFVAGSFNAWQGFDRFAQLSLLLPEFSFRLIVPSGLAVPDVAASRVGVVRVTSHSQFQAEISALDAAIGSLALERKRMHEAAPLKVRDYVDAGIPTALPYTDTNLAGCEDPMLLRLTGEPGGWAAQLSPWLRAVKGQRLLLRTRQAVSIDTIEARRLELLRSSA